MVAWLPHNFQYYAIHHLRLDYILHYIIMLSWCELPSKVELPRAKFQREFAQRRDFCVQNSLALASFENRNFSIFWRDAERFLKQLGLKQHLSLSLYWNLSWKMSLYWNIIIFKAFLILITIQLLRHWSLKFEIGRKSKSFSFW